MAGLFTGLTNASTALNAAQYGLQIAGQNIANINTDGYVRRRVSLAELPPPDGKTGGTVTVEGTKAIRDALLEARLRNAYTSQQQQGALAGSLQIVETALGTVGSSIDGRLASFFNAFGALASDPTAPTLRSSVLVQGSELASAFNDMASQFDDAQRSADTQVRSGVDQINVLAAQVARLNGLIGSANGADTESLKDEQAVALKSLSGFAEINVVQRDDGQADVSIGTGRALVVGSTQYSLGVTSVGPTGFAAITLNNATITNEMTSGSIGGALQIRDTIVPGYKTQLDQLAYAVVNQVNTVHQSGFDANGAAGLAFFTPLASATGAAAAMAVNPTVAANNALVAASGTGTAGDNTTATAMAALQNARVMSGSGTFNDAWARLVYQVGSDSQTAQSNETSAETVTLAVQRLRDSMSSVSLDEEATSMIMFQKAYQANAKYFATVNSALDTLMAMVGVTTA